MLIEDVCQEVNNYFVKSHDDKKFGKFTIKDGILEPSLDILDGQYFRVVGSVFNDGVHKYGDNDLKDEPVFEGSVWLMRVPNDFIQLVDSINEFDAKYGENSPYTSESFAGYSYTRATSADGSIAGWKDVFKNRLNKYRRLKYGTSV